MHKKNKSKKRLNFSINLVIYSVKIKRDQTRLNKYAREPKFRERMV